MSQSAGRRGAASAFLLHTLRADLPKGIILNLCIPSIHDIDPGGFHIDHLVEVLANVLEAGFVPALLQGRMLDVAAFICQFQHTRRCHLAELAAPLQRRYASTLAHHIVGMKDVLREVPGGCQAIKMGVVGLPSSRHLCVADPRFAILGIGLIWVADGLVEAVADGLVENAVHER